MERYKKPTIENRKGAYNKKEGNGGILMGLFTPAWQKYDEQKATMAVNAAVAKDNQKQLARIACEAVNQTVRITAVEALKDQSVIAKVAATDPDSYVRYKAVLKISDQTVLAMLYANEREGYVRSGIVWGMTDQRLLIQIAKTDAEGSVRGMAVRKMTDETALISFACQSIDMGIKAEAIEKITNQKVLADIVRSELNYDYDLTRSFDIHLSCAYQALKRIKNNQALYFDIIRKIKDPGRNEDAGKLIEFSARKLLDDTALHAVARDTEVQTKYRWNAAQKVEKLMTQEDYTSIAMSCKSTFKVSFENTSDCFEALEKISDQNKILFIANHSESILLAAKAMTRLEDPSKIVFRTENAICTEHDLFFSSDLDRHKLPVMVSGGKQWWQCPYCGKPLSKCQYHPAKIGPEPIKEKDRPAYKIRHGG